MANTKDQMTDAYPIVFDFVKGEQPTAQKLSGLVKFVDQGFSNVTTVIGDPQDQTAHAFDLSPEKLTQASIARVLGPADYLSPVGGCWNEPVGSSFTVTLSANKNSWELGFPLVKLTATAKPTSTASIISSLSWGTDITVITDSGSVLSNRVALPEQVDSNGDFYVDFTKGVITAFKPATSNITLQIDNIHMLGSGVPWGSHNVIPTWNQTTGLCDVTKVATVAGVTEYTLTLPTVTHAPRIGQNSLYGGADNYQTSTTYVDAVYSTITCSGQTSDYRLPYSLVENASAGTQIPEGYVLLWDDTNGRIVPSVSFYYKTEKSLTLYTSEDALTQGDGTYRLITSGTSLTEAVGWLMTAFRDNRHQGLTDLGPSGRKTLRFTQVIDHDGLSNLFTGDISSSFSSTVDRWKFRKSSYPVNPHPQYLHRGGYMDSDDDGNSGNAMRGDLVFTGSYDSSFQLGAGSSSGSKYQTYGICWGGGDRDSDEDDNTRLSFEGGESLSAWSSYSGSTHKQAEKIGFGIHETGADPVTTLTEYYGALTYSPWYGTPLYLRGRYPLSGSPTDSTTPYLGAVLGFDVSQRGEMNYIKVMDAVRSGTYDVPNMPAEVLQPSPTTTLYMTPKLDTISNGGVLPDTAATRLSYQQIREFRFRGVSYVDGAKNIGDGLAPNTIGTSGIRSSLTHSSYSITGADSTSKYFTISGNHANYFVPTRSLIVSGTATNNGSYTITSSVNFGAVTRIYVSQSVNTSGSGGTLAMVWGEFDPYFTSPGVVGADFINVYSNAIFFSDTGDGKTTSFTNYGDEYLYYTNDQTKAPTGIYFYPEGVGTAFGSFWPNDDSAAYVLSLRDTSTATQPLYIGDDFGMIYNADGRMYLMVGSTAASRVTNFAAENALSTKALFATAGASEDIKIKTFGAGSDITIETGSGGTLTLSGDSGINVSNLTTTAGSHDVQLLGNTLVKVVSSRRYKTNIKPVSDVSWLYDLEVVNYNMKEGTPDVNRIGVIAEQLEEVNKDLVVYADIDGRVIPDNVDNRSIFYALIKAIQDQKKEINSLKKALAPYRRLG